MPAFFAIQGSIQTKDCEDVYDIVDALESEGIAITIQPVDVGGDDGKFSQTVLLVEIEGGEEMSHTGIEAFTKQIERLSAFAVGVGVFETDTDGDKGVIWVGDPVAVVAAQIEEKVRVAWEALAELPEDEREKLIARPVILLREKDKHGWYVHGAVVAPDGMSKETALGKINKVFDTVTEENDEWDYGKVMKALSDTGFKQVEIVEWWEA